MARLRIRIELNRGSVGVSLHKLASIVDEAQKFFHLLAEDVQIDQTQGDWLGFDFGNESLNFTAEFVGPVTAEQVAAFHAAFNGTTSLRRTTIAQFARITEAIEQDELIGFGLYLSDEGNEPSEWRCLSRRDALRISEELQMLIEASGEGYGESHLPAITNSGVGARLFSYRRERALESTKWAAYARDVEANMDRRISRVEHALEGQSGLIEALHLQSSSIEDSVRKLLTAVEGFSAQTTRQLEAISAPAPPTPVASESAPETARAAAAALAVAQPELIRAPVTDTVAKPDPAPMKTSSPPTPPARRIQSGWVSAVRLATKPKREWRLVASLTLLGIGVVILGVWAWQNLFPVRPVQRLAATSSSSGSSVPVPAATPPSQPPPPVQPPQTTPHAPAPASAHVNLEASELTWVTLRGADGKPMLARLFAVGDTQSLDLPNGATLHVGNAGGLAILLNGNSIGSIGPHGKVREVIFRNGTYKVVAID